MTARKWMNEWILSFEDVTYKNEWIKNINIVNKNICSCNSWSKGAIEKLKLKPADFVIHDMR